MNIAIILLSVLSWTYQGTPFYFNGNTSVLNYAVSPSCMLCCVCNCCHLHSSTKISYFTASKTMCKCMASIAVRCLFTQ